MNEAVKALLFIGIAFIGSIYLLNWLGNRIIKVWFEKNRTDIR